MRGPDLAFLNLYDFVGMITIIPLPKKDDIITKDKDENNNNNTNSDIQNLTDTKIKKSVREGSWQMD